MPFSRARDAWGCACAEGRRARDAFVTRRALTRDAFAEGFHRALPRAAFVPRQGGESEKFKLEAIDFGRRMATERELRKDPEAPRQNAVFDESGNFVIYATLLGIKMVNIVTNRLSRLVGKVENSERFLRVALYQ
eukprot:4704835-Pyramimonas_sp.AAC.1